MTEAVSEIERVARTDPAIAGEGAVLLLESSRPRLAVSDTDGFSGALGNATAGAVKRFSAHHRRGASATVRAKSGSIGSSMQFRHRA